MFEDRKICREEIESHRGKIAAAIDEFIELLSNRAKTHDKSKLEEPQFSAFAALPRNGHRPDYASKEYLTGLETLGSALADHYALERHHPEHFADGISGMTLVDLVEMFIDWQVSWKEHGTGTFEETLKANQVRFDASDQLIRIFHNTFLEHDRIERRP